MSSKPSAASRSHSASGTSASRSVRPAADDSASSQGQVLIWYRWGWARRGARGFILAYSNHMTTVVEPVPVDFARQREVAAALRAFLPAESVLFEREDVQPYECDGLSAYRQVPMVVALPANEEEVRRIVKVCYDKRVPVVARGAGTGLSG